MRGTVRVLAAVPRLFRAYHAPAPSLGLSATSARGGLGVFFLKLRPLFRALPRACPVPHPKRCSARLLTFSPPRRTADRFALLRGFGRGRRVIASAPHVVVAASASRPPPCGGRAFGGSASHIAAFSPRLGPSPLRCTVCARLRATPCRRASSPLRAVSGLAVGLRPTRVPPRRPLLNARLRARVYALRLYCYHDIRRLNR